MELSAYALHEDAALLLCRATERVRVRGVSAREATVTFSDRFAWRVAPDPAADLLDRRHQWIAEQHRPGNAEAELGAHLGVSGDATRIVIRRPGNKSRAKNA